jgi:hypothetical protein
MKRALVIDREGSTQKRKTSSAVGQGNGHLQVNEEALKQFALMKKSARSYNEEELQEVFSILRRWKVLDTYESQMRSLMPEIYCLFKVISEQDHTDESIAVRLPYIVVSVVLIASLVMSLVLTVMLYRTEFEMQRPIIKRARMRSLNAAFFMIIVLIAASSTQALSLPE